MKDNTCRELHKVWEAECMDVWNSTIDMCSDQCKNATNELYKDPHGQNFKWCDCGPHENIFDGPRTPKEMAAIDQCFVRQSKMRKICKFDDAGQCQKCEAKKSM